MSQRCLIDVARMESTRCLSCTSTTRTASLSCRRLFPLPFHVYLLLLLTMLVSSPVVHCLLDTVTLDIQEELAPGSYIGDIKVSAELDQEYPPMDLEQLRFTLLPPDNDDHALAADYFEIEEASGLLKVSDVIDRDSESLCAYQSTCQLVFEVAVGPARYFQVITVRVNVLDVNDNAPRFARSEYHLNLSESAIPGTAYNLPSVYDLDSVEFGIQRFDLRPNTDLFNITWSRDLNGRVQPKLQLTRSLDREQIESFDLSVVAYDSGAGVGENAVLLVRVTVQDTNDNSPVFALPSYEARVSEDASPGRSVLTIHAEDPDAGLSGTVRYTLQGATQGASDSSSQGGDLAFRIDPDTGVVYLKDPVDRERQDTYYLTVTASDRAKEPRLTSTSLIVYVDDVNDNAPVIHVSVITPSGRAEVSEAAARGTFVALVSVVDRDWGQNAEASCRLQSSASQHFALTSMESLNKFKVVTDSQLDREQRGRYDLLVSCEDRGLPVRSSHETVTVYVTDVNDHAPVFSSDTYRAAIDENNRPLAYVTAVECSDLDDGANGLVTYRLLDHTDTFTIDPETGVLRATQPLDFETEPEFRVTVEASDGGDPPRSASSLVIVQVRDVNDQPPEFTDDDVTFNVRENQLDYASVGRVAASEEQQRGRVWYSLASETPGALDHFVINRDNGSLWLVRPLDRELGAVYRLTVTATNHEPPAQSATAQVTVLVDDVNDNPPAVSFPSGANNTVQISHRLPPGYKVTQIHASDPDAGQNAELSYFLVQQPRDVSQQNQLDPFGIDPKSGEIFLNHDMSQTSRPESYELRVLVKDGGVPELSTTVSVNVVVNQSLLLGAAFPENSPGQPSGSHRGSGGDRNMTIIIIVVAVSGVVIIVLLASIVFVLLTSRRKRPMRTHHRHDAMTTAPIVMDPLELKGKKRSEGTAGDTEDPESGELRITAAKDPEAKLQLHEEFQRYEPPNRQPYYSYQEPKPSTPSYQDTAPPRGLYVNYHARAPPIDVSFMSEESDQTREELQALTKKPPSRTPCPLHPSDSDRQSASSVEDSVTDSGRGASEEGDPLSGDEQHGQIKGPRSNRPVTTSKTRPELLLGPGYPGLSQIQTEFDPHYRLKYNNLDYPTSSSTVTPYPSKYNSGGGSFNIPAVHSSARPTSQQGDASGGFTDCGSNHHGLNNTQRLRDVKAKDRHKKVDPVISNNSQNSSLMNRYRGTSSSPRDHHHSNNNNNNVDVVIHGNSNHNRASPNNTCAFSDATSLMKYKGPDTTGSAGCLSEKTDVTSEASATSGSYVIDHEDDHVDAVRLPIGGLTVSQC